VNETRQEAQAKIPSASIDSTNRGGQERARLRPKEIPCHYRGGSKFVAYLLARNIRYEEDLVDQHFYSGEKRLARLVLSLAHFGKEGVPETVIPKISQETLAETIGTTRSRVRFFMNKFRTLGFVDLAGADASS
jgi:hypothetical protein